MRKIVLRLDGDFQIGLGHAVRCAALIAALAKPVALHLVGRGEGLARIFPGVPVTSPDVLDQLPLPDLVLMDRPDIEPAFWTWAKTCGASIVVIDDVGGSFPAHLIINGTVLPDYHHYRDVLPEGRVAAGAGFALLRADFAKARAARSEQFQGEGVVIVAGSGARAAAWVKLLLSGALPFADWAPVTLVVGSAQPDAENVRMRCAALGIAFAQGLDGAGLAALLSQAAVALTTGRHDCL